MTNTTKWAGIERDVTSRAHAQEKGLLERQIKNYQNAIEELEHRLSVVLPLSNVTPTRDTIVIPKSSKKSEAAVFAIASDWHIEETVDPDTVNGLNEFNLEIADQRIETFFASVLKLTDIERNGVHIDTLVLALLGDFINGYLQTEMVEDNSLSPVEAVIWVQERLLKGINTLRKYGNFKKIVIPCSVGNHARTTEKSRIATVTKNNFEFLMYTWLSQSITDGVEWQIATGYHNFISVYDRVICFHHGDHLKYGGGIGGLTIPVEKALAQWSKGKYFDMSIFGHWHQFMQNPRWLCNGSLVGYGPYALSIKAAYEPPQQTLFLLDSQRGRTATWPIFV